MSIIEVREVKKSYGKKEVLHQVNLSVEEGSIHGFIGRNGCGKTTLIKCMTGIYKVDAGEIKICGEPVYENPKVKAQIGYVADQNHYFENYRIDEMVDFYQKMYPTFQKKDFENYNEAIGLAYGQKIMQLSKGQSMVLASMLNLSIHPKVLIMDEPLSGLDAIVQNQVKEFLVNEVEMNGMTVFISSHNLKDMESFCDSMTMMREGTIISQGNIDEVKAGLAKIQAVFPNGMPESLAQLNGLITYSNIGSIYTIVMENYSETMKEALMEMGASLVEEIPLSLEEAFIYNNQ